MNVKDLLIQEWNEESKKTLKMLQRIPGERWDWRPHPRSWTMAELTTHLANIPNWMGITLTRDSLDLVTGGGRAELIPDPEKAPQQFIENSSAASNALAEVTEEDLWKPWTLLAGGTEQFTLPRIVVLRSFVFNHLVHHRTQLGVYLRLCDIPVPGMYGPSADEK